MSVELSKKWSWELNFDGSESRTHVDAVANHFCSCTSDNVSHVKELLARCDYSHGFLNLFLPFICMIVNLTFLIFSAIVFNGGFMKIGRFFVIEGKDGAGKSTFVKALKERYPDFVYSREPDGLVRKLVLSDDAKNFDTLTMFNLFWASRAENFAKVILPALQGGKNVVSDRFDVSTYAYQVGETRKLEKLFWLTRDVCLRGVFPVYLNFDASVEVSKQRLQSRGDQNHFDSRDDEYHARVRASYDEFFSDGRVWSVKIDANQPVDQVIADGMKQIEICLNT